MLREIVVLCDQRCAEKFGDLLMDAGVMSVTTEDADADSLDEQPLYGEPGLEPETLAWSRSRLRLLADDSFDAVTSIALAAAALRIETPLIESDSAVPDEDWVRVTQAQFPPTRVSDRLWIVPTWHTPPQEQAINIRLDPGVAFGTGSHPTTHLCLQWIDQHCPANASVLDFGCGTGILAIAASKVGARLVKGTDIDPQAVESARANAQVNDVTAEFVLPEQLGDETFDIVIANILANPLKFLAPTLLSKLGSEGTLVLSGILEHQAQDVIDVYRQKEPHLDLRIAATENGWVCIAGTRK